MTTRVQLTAPHYMPLDGQWQIVDTGSVVDCHDTMVPKASTTLAETAGTLKVGTNPTLVRGKVTSNGRSH